MRWPSKIESLWIYITLVFIALIAAIVHLISIAPKYQPVELDDYTDNPPRQALVD